MPTYQALKEQGYFQYLVMISIGTYEGSSVASICFYVLLNEEKTPTQLADDFKSIMKEYTDIRNDRFGKSNPTPASDFVTELFHLQGHETCGSDFDRFEIEGWNTNPHHSIPITKIVTLQGMDEYCEDDPDGDVLPEIFDIIDVNNPKL